MPKGRAAPNPPGTKGYLYRRQIHHLICQHIEGLSIKEAAKLLNVGTTTVTTLQQESRESKDTIYTLGFLLDLAERLGMPFTFTIESVRRPSAPRKAKRT